MAKSEQKRDPRAFDDTLAEQLAWLMDSSIGLGPISIGLDGIVGLIPGIGDVLTSMVGVWIVARAMKHGVPRYAILRMLVNLGIDALVGAIPVAGDLFDFAYKANLKNIQIYKESMSGTRAPLKDWAFLAFVTVILLVTTVLPLVCALTKMPLLLPEITLRSAAVVPPMTLFGDWT
jgi:hypothetical protein